MKRIFALLLVAVLMLSLTACELPIPGFGSNKNDDHERYPMEEPEEEMIAPTIAPQPVPMPSEPVMMPTEPAPPTEPVVTECPHDFAEATCNDPAKCNLCGKTKGDALGHNYEGGDCENPGKCTRCGKKSSASTGHNDGWGGKCTVCGAKTDRFYDIQEALEKSERYPKYISINYDLICTQYDLFKLNGEMKHFTDAHENVLEIHDYLKKIVKYCEKYKELDMLTEECEELLLKMPTVPGSTSSSAIRSYLSDAKSFALKASRISVIYNVLCKSYDLPGV